MKLASNTRENVRNLHLSGAGHFSMTDLALASPVLTTLLEGGQNHPNRVGFFENRKPGLSRFFQPLLKKSGLSVGERTMNQNTPLSR